MENLKKKSVGELVKLDFRAADIFSKYRIDFCCGGHVSVEQASIDSKADLTDLLNELEALKETSVSPAYEFDKWNISFLVDFIQNTHHQYVRSALPSILTLANKVAEVHGEHHSEVISIKTHFENLANELTSHMKDEEEILFPYVRKKMAEISSGNSGEKLDSLEILEPVSAMIQEHENAGAVLKQISALSNSYKTPDDACNTFRVFYAKLKEFEDDLHRHIHLENNILFPKLLGMEN